MCGITGFVDRLNRSSNENRDILFKMCDAIRYRGPDDEGFFVDGCVGLGMKRLSIIDLATGHQPMTTEDGRFTIVYNGEVYNFRELRQELEANGVIFNTKSDTEVVLKIYQHYGAAGFAKLNGMFGFAVYDRKERKLTLCRDPIGIKPLYYYLDSGVLVFASEIKAILCHPALSSKKLNMQAIWDYLTYEYVPSPHTVFCNVFKLLPGHYLEFSLDTKVLKTTPYWEFPLCQKHDYTVDECVGLFENNFRTAVKRQLVADVPVGVFLSGGLDSSAVVAAAREVSSDRVKTFCIGFKEGTLTDETIYAREVAKYLKTEHFEHKADAKEFIGFIPEYVYLMDEPNADMATIGKYFACKLASRHVKVVLSGDGGDEMLCGYRFNEAMQRFSHLRALQKLPKRLFRDMPLALFNFAGCDDFSRRWKRMFIPLNERGQFALPSMTKRFSEDEKKELFRQTPKEVKDSLKILSEDFKQAQTLGPLTQIQYAWSKQWLSEHLLMEADRMSMAVSLELRVPFLDLDLVRFLFSVPDEIKVSKVKGKYQTKYLLRQYLKGRVPMSVLKRPKRGFQVPNIRFIRADLAKEISETLLDKDSHISRLMDPGVIANWIKRSKHNDRGMAYQRVWILYMLEVWLRRWCR